MASRHLRLTKRRLLAGAVVLLLAVAGIIVALRFRSQPDQMAAPTGQATVTVKQGGSLHWNGVTVTVPPGAVSSDGRLVARASTAPSAAPASGTASPAPSTDPQASSNPAGSVPSLALTTASLPVALELVHTQIVHPISLTIPVKSDLLPQDPALSSRPDIAWLAAYNPQTGQWEPVPSQYDGDRRSVTAQVSHLSDYSAQTLDWQAIALHIRQFLSAFDSGRAPTTSCPSTAPGVTINDTGGPDPPIFGCVTAGPSDTLLVSIINDRAYAMTMATPQEATAQPPSYSGFDQWIATRNTTSNALGAPYFAPTATLSYSVPGHGDPVTFTASPSLKTWAVQFSYAAAGSLFDAAFEAALDVTFADCALNAIARSEPASVRDVPKLAVSCIPVLAQIKGALTFLVTPIQLFIQAILAANDQTVDRLANVQGSVQINRPAPPIPDLFVVTGYERGAFYQNPKFPSSIGIDNHDGYSGLIWAVGPDQAAATGTLNQRDCTPNCAEGTTVTYPIRITASDPRQCQITVYSDYSDAPQVMSAYVFTSLSVRALSGTPRADLVGDSVIGSPCD